MPRPCGSTRPKNRPIGPRYGFRRRGSGVRASTRKLVDLAAREHVALIIYGHDAEEWKKLKKAPEFYS